MITIRESAHEENEEGIWLAIVAGQEEAVRARISRPEAERPSEVSLWWNGSATASTVRDWVAETIELVGPKLECRVKVWADHAPEEDLSYRIGSVGRIVKDIQKWAEDGAVACSMAFPGSHHDLIYMWAELKSSDAKTHTGEVGLQYPAKALREPSGKIVFSRLLEHTALRRYSGQEIGLLYDILAEKVGDAAREMSEARRAKKVAAASF